MYGINKFQIIGTGATKGCTVKVRGTNKKQLEDENRVYKGHFKKTEFLRGKKWTEVLQSATV